MAGYKLRTAVPDVQTMATGFPKATAIPKAVNPAERSSTSE